MYDTDPRDVANSIREAVISLDHSKLNECILEFATFCSKECQPERDPFPEIVFQTILDMMGNCEFQRMEDSQELLMVFEYEWGRLSEDQKRRLLSSISAAYEMFSDWMSYFVLSELLGEFYCNEDSFEVLCELRRTSNEVARSLVPHGFEHIAEGAESSDLRRRGLEQLVSMKEDASPQVKNEVAEALSNLGLSQ